MTDTRDNFMKAAIDLSREKMAGGDGGPFGAIIVKDGKVVGRGWNRTVAENDPTAHAEIVAIRDACRALGTYELTGCELYSSCEPCPMCMTAAMWARLDKVYFGAGRADAKDAGFDDEYFYDEIEKPPGERDLPAEQLLRDYAVRALEEWKLLPDKVIY